MSKQAHVVDRSYIDAELKSKEIKTENRYRKDRARKDAEELKELERLTNQNTEDDNEPATGGDPNTKTNSGSTSEDNTDWKKRYSDLRSYASKLENTNKETITSLERRIQELEADKNKPSYPKTEEEIQEWVEKYPDVAGIIQTIAGKISDEKVLSLQARYESLAQKEREMERNLGLKMLLEKHPDFLEIQATEQFQMWLNSEPQNTQDAIKNPKDFGPSSVKAAARVIDIYKNEHGLSTQKVSKENTQAKRNESNKMAATQVTTSVSDDPRRETREFTIRESEVAAMSDREFEQMQSKIIEAQRKGNFIYDLSGGAR